MLFASIPLVDNLVWLFVAQFLIEAISLFWIPAKDAAVPNMLRKDQLEPANQFSLVTTYGLTPVLAAVVFAVLTTMGARSMRLPSRPRRGGPGALPQRADLPGRRVRHLEPAVDQRQARRRARPSRRRASSARSSTGFSFAGHTPLVRGLVVGITGAFAAAGVIIATGQAYATALGGGEAAYGLLFGAVFIGLGLGIAIGPSVARDLARERIFGVAIVGAGAMVLLMAWTFTLWIALLLVVFMGFFAGIAYLAGFTLLGTEVEDEIRGRTFAIVQSLVRAALILSLAVVPFGVGLLGQHELDLGRVHDPVTGERIMLLVAGLLAIGVGVLAYRQMDDGRPVPLLADVVTALRRDTTARRRLAGGGVLIAFEGGEGAGKSTQVRRLQEWLTSEGLVSRATFEPGATPSGRRHPRRSCSTARTPRSPRARRRCSTPPTGPSTCNDVLRPALDAGEVVITDRFVDSSLAYQGAGRTIPLDDVRMLSRWATQGLEPDLTVLLDLPPEAGLARARGRAVADRLESESLDFHQRVRQTFLALAEADPDRYLVLDAQQTPEAIAAAIRVRVAELLSGLPLQTFAQTEQPVADEPPRAARAHHNVARPAPPARPDRRDHAAAPVTAVVPRASGPSSSGSRPSSPSCGRPWPTRRR